MAMRRAKADGTRYISNIEMPGGTVKYVPLQPPERGATEKCSASEWTIDMTQLEKAITPKTKMIVRSSPELCVTPINLTAIGLELTVCRIRLY